MLLKNSFFEPNFAVTESLMILEPKRTGKTNSKAVKY